MALASVAQLVGASSHRLKGCGFDPCWGSVQEGDGSILLSHISFSLSLSLSFPPSLSFSLSKIIEKVSSDED